MLKTESETYSYLCIICTIFKPKMKDLKGEAEPKILKTNNKPT